MIIKMRKEINLEIDFACLDIGGHYTKVVPGLEVKGD